MKARSDLRGIYMPPSWPHVVSPNHTEVATFSIKAVFAQLMLARCMPFYIYILRSMISYTWYWVLLSFLLPEYKYPLYECHGGRREFPARKRPRGRRQRWEGDVENKPRGKQPHRAVRLLSFVVPGNLARQRSTAAAALALPSGARFLSAFLFWFVCENQPPQQQQNTTTTNSKCCRTEGRQRAIFCVNSLSRRQTSCEKRTLRGENKRYSANISS